MAKDAKGHGSEKRGTAPGYAGRDALGRTYTAAIRDHDRFPAQNPDMPNAEHYRTDKAAANELAKGNPKAEVAPIHSGMTDKQTSYKPSAENKAWNEFHRTRATSGPHYLDPKDPRYGSPEAIKDFTNKYGGPRDVKAEQRGFNSGKREINRLRKQGK